MLRVALLVVCSLVVGTLPAVAEGLGLSFSTDTFVSFGEPSDPAVPPGLYGRAGVAWLPGRHLELELCHVPRLTPRFYSPVLFGASGSWWLIGRSSESYFNAVVGGGVLYGLDGTLLVVLRLSPLVLGGPDYAFSDRLLTLGLVLDPTRPRLLLELQILALTLYL